MQSDVEENIELLEAISLVSDYLVCTLLEEEFNPDFDERKVVEGNSSEKLSDNQLLNGILNSALK